MSASDPIRMQHTAPFRNLIQVAGVHDMAEAAMLAETGFHSIGFPLRLPVNHEDCTEAQATDMAARLRAEYPHVTPVCICYLDCAEAIAALCDDLGMQHVQLHGPIAVTELARLRELRPLLYIIKSLVIWPDGANAAQLEADMAAYAPHVDAFITDTHNPRTGADGATGMPHDWSVSRRLVNYSPRPVILAGGLTPENVGEAICTVRPAGVDVHSSVEGADGRKERNRTLRFFTEATKAFTKISAILT